MKVAAARPSRRMELNRWLDRELSTLGCVAGWVLASVAFLGLAALLGGPSEGDAALSVFSTWAIAHGQIACAYSSHGMSQLPPFVRPSSFLPPLYPILSAAALFLLHSTYNVPFPTVTQLGNHCTTSTAAIYKWANDSHAIIPTIRIGYLTWFSLMTGTIALLRATGRGRKIWEPAALLLIAVIAPVFECLTEYYHPQDILAMGLVIGSLACALRGRWTWAGILIGIAFTSNQFALLVAGPVFIVAARKYRFAYAIAAVATVIVISVPIIIFTSGKAVRASVLGSGFSPAKGGTLLWQTHITGAMLFIVARLFPIAIAMTLAWWVKKRLGERVLQPGPFLSIVTIALVLRLVFEFSLYGYFFLGVATMLVLNDVIAGRIRGEIITWFALATVIFDPFPWGFASNGQAWGLMAREWLPNAFVIVGVLIILSDLYRRHIRWYIVAAVTYVGVTLVTWPWNHEALRHPVPTWLIQILLVSCALWLASAPLLAAVRESDDLVPTHIAPNATICLLE